MPYSQLGDSVAEQAVGICYECQTKNNDSSEKPVYLCDACRKWFCGLHKNPKFPYFVDWETQFDVQGNPVVKTMFYSEFGRKDGHSDLVYFRNKIMEMELEEEYQNFLIKTAMDRMNLYGKPLREMVIPVIETKHKLTEKQKRATATRTYANKFTHEFPIPAGIYSVDEYYNRLNYARTLEEVDEIVDDYKHGRHIIQPEQKETDPSTSYRSQPSRPISRKVLALISIGLIFISLAGVIYFSPAPPQNSQDVVWESYNYTLQAGSEYTITLKANSGFTFESWRYVTSTHLSSTEVQTAQSILTVSGDKMTINAYFEKDQTNQVSVASISLTPTSTMNLDLEVANGSATIKP
jgi:hypothetical protein